jgi:ATP-dependent protease ClpP protease subunit
MIIEYNNLSRFSMNVIKDNEPVIIKVNQFNEGSVSDVEKGIREAHMKGQKFIPLHIDSYGGQVYSLNAMISLIKSSSIPVVTFVSGKAMSCGLILLGMGTKGYRFASPEATGMLHEVSSVAAGKTTDMESSVEETKRLNELIYANLGGYCKADRYYFFDILKEARNTDVYFTAEEMLKHGLIDYIKVPKIEYTVQATSSIIY